MKEQKKWLIYTVALVMLGLMFGCSNDQSVSPSQPVEEPVTVKVEEPEKVFNYYVYSIEDYPFANAKRYSYNVIIEEEYSEDQMKEIAVQIVEKAKKEKPFNAISLLFYDYPEYIGHGTVFGLANYAPNGDWGQAAEVETGDYSTMEYSFDLNAKDWANRPSPNDIAVFVEWNRVTKLQDFETDEDVVKYMVENSDLGMSFDEIDAASTRAFMWQW